MPFQVLSFHRKSCLVYLDVISERNENNKGNWNSTQAITAEIVYLTNPFIRPPVEKAILAKEK